MPGHWEGDLFFGSNNSQIATLVERQTRYLMLARAAGKDTETVVNALIKQAHKLPRELYRSLTWDRGKEMADLSASRWPPTSRSTSAILNSRGSAVPTRTPTVYCASTSRKGWICRTSIRTGSMGSHDD